MSATVNTETGEVTEEPDETEEEFNNLPDEDGAPDEDAPDTQPEPEPEPVDDPGPSPEALIKLGRSFDNYGKNVASTYGDDFAALLECPLCPGNHKGFVDLRYAGQVPREIESEVYAYLTASNVGTLEQDPGTHACSVCKGKTMVRTGAIAGQYVTVTCPNCKGYGYMPPPGTPPAAATQNGNGEMPVVPLEQTGPSEDVDEWGEPRTLPDGTVNSNFGMMPNRKTIHPVYGVTANLTRAEAV